MGKFRGHQDKSRRKREAKHKLKIVGKGRSPAVNGAVTVGGARDDNNDKKNPPASRKLKHVTYEKDKSVLICGDGDFSFTNGVIRHRGTGKGVVATSLDSQKTVLKKYPRAVNWLPKLCSDGAQVVHSVDATKLEQTLFGGVPRQDGSRQEEQSTEGKEKETENKNEDVGDSKPRRVLFDRVVFNFPHTGVQRTHLNRNLIRDFFASTKGLVKCAAAGGEIHVTLKDKPPYSGWNIRAMAKESELVMVRCLAFDPSVFPGYRHSTTDPQAKEFDATRARTHVFCRARSSIDDEVDTSGAFPVISEAVDTVKSNATNFELLNDHEGGGEAAFIDSEHPLMNDDGFDSDDLGGTATISDVPDGNGDTRDLPSTITKDRRKNRRKKSAPDKNKPIASSVHTGGVVGQGDGKPGEEHAGEGGMEGGPGSDGAESKSAGKGELRPPLVKKKAAKRRAQRKKAAEAAKAAVLADASGIPTENIVSKPSPETLPAAGKNEGINNISLGSAKKAGCKRNRGKYVRKKLREGWRNQDSRGDGTAGRSDDVKRSKLNVR